MANLQADALVELRAAGLEDHPHARAVLLGALQPSSNPSHAYLFHGPPGAGKRAVARAFAAALLLDGAREPITVRERVAAGTHPDLTWVTPSGASEVLVGDIDQPVVAAVQRTPFESARRVFVIEAAGTMNDQAANRLLKTLEEPPAFAHLILLAAHREDVLPTIASRCQQVRFEALSEESVQARLLANDPALEPARAAACARLAAGDGALAAGLAGEGGAALRATGEGLARFALDEDAVGRPWLEMLELAKAAGAEAGESTTERLRERAELLPSKERRKFEREGVDVVRRAERRARTSTLDLCLRLAGLWLRDLACLASGAGELVLNSDRGEQLAGDAAGGQSAQTLLSAVQLVEETRLRLELNVAEELALEALAYQLRELLS